MSTRSARLILSTGDGFIHDLAGIRCALDGARRGGVDVPIEPVDLPVLLRHGWGLCWCVPPHDRLSLGVDAA